MSGNTNTTAFASLDTSIAHQLADAGIEARAAAKLAEEAQREAAEAQRKADAAAQAVQASSASAAAQTGSTATAHTSASPQPTATPVPVTVTTTTDTITTTPGGASTAPTTTRTTTTTTVAQPRSWLRRALSLPNTGLREAVGLAGTAVGFFNAASIAWELGRDWYVENIIQPSITLLVALTYPGAIIPSQVISYIPYVWANTDKGLMFAAIFSKSIPGKYFKDAKDMFKDWVRATTGIGKHAPNAHSLSLESVRFQVIDKVSDVLALGVGLVGAVTAMLSVRAVTSMAANFFQGLPIIGPISKLGAVILTEAKKASYAMAMVVIAKEAVELSMKWAESFFKGRYDDVIDGVAAVSDRGEDAYNTAGREAYNTASTAAAYVRDSAYSAGEQVVNTMTAPFRFLGFSSASAGPAAAATAAGVAAVVAPQTAPVAGAVSAAASAAEAARTTQRVVMAAA